MVFMHTNIKKLKKMIGYFQGFSDEEVVEVEVGDVKKALLDLLELKEMVDVIARQVEKYYGIPIG